MTPVAIITGASSGFGRAVAAALAGRGWTLILDARRPEPLRAFASTLGRHVTALPADGAALHTGVTALPGDAAATLDTGITALPANGAGVTALPGDAAATLDAEVTALPGDVADPGHRAELAAAVRRLGRLDLLINNASALGPSPQPPLERYPLDELARVYQVNVFAPLALAQLVLPALRESGGALVNISSDAAVEAYEGWGGYGSAKAALDQLTAILGAEQPRIKVYAFDPGDMRTDMHQQAFPGEDISDRPEPETVVPALLRLLDERPASGRYRSVDLAAVAS